MKWIMLLDRCNEKAAALSFDVDRNPRYLIWSSPMRNISSTTFTFRHPSGKATTRLWSFEFICYWRQWMTETRYLENVSKACLEVLKSWSNTRVRGDSPIVPGPRIFPGVLIHALLGSGRTVEKENEREIGCSIHCSWWMKSFKMISRKNKVKVGYA